jgi:hypothetical protein
MSSLPMNVNDGSFPIPTARLNLDVGTASFLPSTAPVSSLLPQIPTNHHHHPHHPLVNPSAAAIQAQLAVLLTQGAASAAVGGQQLSTVANPLLASTAALPTPLLSANTNMHGWTADQIGRFITVVHLIVLVRSSYSRGNSFLGGMLAICCVPH